MYDLLLYFYEIFTNVYDHVWEGLDNNQPASLGKFGFPDRDNLTKLYINCFRIILRLDLTFPDNRTTRVSSGFLCLHYPRRAIK
jgi:hypothetical protein